MTTTDNADEAQAPYCLCGCGIKTKGGSFVPGHDARYKSQLIAKVIEGKDEDGEALRTIESRGWTKFLDKRRAVVSRVTAPKRHRKTEEDAAAAKGHLYLMKAAAKILRWTDQYRKSARNHMPILAANAYLIASRQHPLLELPDDGTEPEPFTEWEQAAIDYATVHTNPLAEETAA
jgi:hypothetical protein